uniref:R-spondin 4 n=1 Tax=Poecilia reticulata TaxID=8081 RepID=A0A3P9QH40_POERE
FVFKMKNLLFVNITFLKYCQIYLLISHRETSEDCQSCLECSRDNGCVRCPERLFLFLQRKGMSHHGTCLHSCPNGHFGQRGRDVNRCMKCRSSDCELCFSRDFCTKCKPGFKLHKGKCLIQCPEGTFAHQTDCLVINCDQSPWSEWSVCVRDGATCGFRWGKQTRVREKATEKASVCSPQRETQRCRMKKKCPTGKRERSRSASSCAKMSKTCNLFIFFFSELPTSVFGHSRAINNAKSGGIGPLKTFQSPPAQRCQVIEILSPHHTKHGGSHLTFKRLYLVAWYYKTKVIKFSNFSIE